jgi:hypothetical protein
MNNNNFLSKTLKTFLTSLFVSVFIFGSLYFFLSDNSGTESKSKDVKSASNNDKSKKLVVDEEPKKENKVEELVARQNETERQVLGATTDNLIAQNIPGATDYTSPFQNTATSTTPAATPTSVLTGTLPTNLTTTATTNGTTVYATGVPKTGNESLYIILGLFSTVAGFLIVNGKSFAMRSFEQI